MITRSQWGARTPSRPLSYLPSAKGVKVHYTGSMVSVHTLTDHAECIEAVKGIQNGHMNGNGWNDIGYSMIACAHDFFEGRGVHKLPAANGAGLNSGHYAVLVLVGSSGVVTPSDAHRRQAWRAIDYLRANGNAGNEIKGHRDGYSTSCPGEPLYALVKQGFPRPTGSVPTTPPNPSQPTTGDDMTPEYLSYGYNKTTPLTVPTGPAWTRVPWDTEYSDKSNEHTGEGHTMLLGDSSLYVGAWFAKFSGLPADTIVQLRVSEFKYNGTLSPPVDELKEEGLPTNTILSSDGMASHHDVGSVSEGRKLFLEVRHDSAVAGSLVMARAKIQAWQ